MIKQYKWTKARVYVYSDSVLCLGKMLGPEDAIKRWNDQVSTLKMCHTIRELQGLDGEPIDFEWKSFQGAAALDLLHEIQARSARKARHTWKFQWSNNLHVYVQRHCSWKARKWRFLRYYFKEDQRVRLQVQRWTLGILGTRRRKQVVSRKDNQSWWLLHKWCIISRTQDSQYSMG